MTRDARIIERFYLTVSLAAFLEAVAQRSLAVCEELKAVPYLRFHSGGFDEACPQRADASLQLPPGKKKKKHPNRGGRRGNSHRMKMANTTGAAVDHQENDDEGRSPVGGDTIERRDHKRAQAPNERTPK